MKGRVLEFWLRVLFNLYMASSQGAKDWLLNDNGNEVTGSQYLHQMISLPRYKMKEIRESDISKCLMLKTLGIGLSQEVTDKEN